MKNTCILLLILSMLFGLTGCQLPSVDKDALSTLTDELGQLLPEQSAAPNTPLYSVSLPVVSDPIQADDGKEIFRYNYQNISLIIPDPEVADRIIIDFLNRIDASAQTAEQLKTDAMKAYNADDAWTPYLCSILYTPSRLDSAIFSLYGAYSTYSGAPHPETAYSGVTYDTLTGSVLSLQDILTAQATTDTFTSLIITQLQETGDSHLYTGYQDTIKSRFKDFEDTGWYLSASGLCIYFSPYEIASYASGKIVVEIPYEKLTGILKDAYFPTEQQTPTGTVSASAFETEKASKYSQITEVILHEGGTKQLLHTDGIVYNVTLETGTLHEGQFIPEATVYLAHSLTATDAVMVEHQLAEQQVLRVSYTGQNGSTVSHLTGTSELTSG